MTAVNDADAIYLGADPVDRVYVGATMVWPELQVPSGKIVRMYYPGYSRTPGTVGHTSIDEIPWGALTHIVDFSVGLHAGGVSATWVDNGGATVGNGWTAAQADALVAAAHTAGRKAILCVGSNDTSNSWNANLDTAGKRTAIAAALADLVALHGYDGVDLDGEPAADIVNYIPFVEAVLAEFTGRGWRGVVGRRTVTVTCEAAGTPSGPVEPPPPPSGWATISGGTVVQQDGWNVHTFTADGEVTVTAAGDVEYLVVGGGGGGGTGQAGGGGGGGGVRTGYLEAAVGTVPVTVGAGGTGAKRTSEPALNGANSTFGPVVAAGGGGGGTNITGGEAKQGGSGGGAVGANVPLSGGAGTSGQGHPGGSNDGTSGTGGGGGGAGTAGQNANGDVKAGDGGSGWTGWGGPAAGGGGGASRAWAGGAGSGQHGGGDGGFGADAPGTAGQPNSGGGGGGSTDGTGGAASSRGGNGGSGIVRVRVPTDPAQPPPENPPAPPSGLTATAGSGQVALTWTAAAAATGHRVWRATVSNFASAVQVGPDLAAHAGSYTDSSAVNGTTYHYWVTAHNTAGQSGPSNGVSATPAAPPSTYPTIQPTASPTVFNVSTTQEFRDAINHSATNKRIVVANGTYGWLPNAVGPSPTSGSLHIVAVNAGVPVVPQIRVVNWAKVIVEGMRFEGICAAFPGGTSGQDYGLSVFNVRQLLAWRCHFEGQYCHDISLKERTDRAEIVSCTFVGTRMHGVEVGQDPRVESVDRTCDTCIVFDCTFQDVHTNAITQRYNRNLIVEANRFVNVAGHCVHNILYYFFEYAGQGWPWVPTGSLRTTVRGNSYTGSVRRLTFNGRGRLDDRVLVQESSGQNVTYRCNPMLQREYDAHVGVETQAGPINDPASTVGHASSCR